MKVLRFTTVIPEAYRHLSYTEAVLAVEPRWNFMQTVGALLVENKIQGLIRNIDNEYFVESYYFVEDGDFEHVKDHFIKNLSIFENTVMPIKFDHSFSPSLEQIRSLVNSDNQEVQILNPEKFASIM